MKSLRVFYGLSKLANCISVVFENKVGEGDKSDLGIKPLYWRYQTPEEEKQKSNSSFSFYTVHFIGADCHSVSACPLPVSDIRRNNLLNEFIH